ncbi:MAG: PEP-CTERM sorting domain-containing protein [Bryobacteraceae bacterium]
MLLRTSFKTCSIAILLLNTWLAAGIPAQAGPIGITYSFAGALIGPPVISGGFLTVDGAASGFVDQWNPLANAVWNPVTFDTIDHVNLATGSNNGTFTMAFANGEMLSGALFEDDSMVNTATGTGPFTQTLTFTAGTGEFAGVTGFSSGGGSVIAGVFTETGSGALTAPGLVVPEPGSIMLVFGGIAFIAVRFRRLRTKCAAL